MNTIVVSIHGGARPNDRSDPKGRAAFGVSFGSPGCPRNTHGTLELEAVQTSQRAILEALRQALTILENMYHDGEFLDRYKEIIIKTNNNYLAMSMDEWIWTWLGTGGKKSNGKLVEHWPTILELHKTICRFESSYWASVRFWKVDREDIEDADTLMKSALGPRGDEVMDSSSESSQ